MAWRVNVRRHDVAFGAVDRPSQSEPRFQVSAVRTDARERLIGAAENIVRRSRADDGRHAGGQARRVSVASVTPASIVSQLNHAVGMRLRQLLTTHEGLLMASLAPVVRVARGR